LFLRHFTEQQKRSLTIMAYRMMMADQVAKGEEKSIIAALKHELGDIALSKEDFEGGPDLGLFVTRREKMAALLKLAAIAYSDREFHKAEVALIVKYGREFEISTEDLRQIDRWARRHQVLVSDAEALIRGDQAEEPSPSAAI
jgi:uncharacterized tellurite resistance protein B-like protein